MIPGLNHNVRYRNRVFHVQTEDKGFDRAQLTTHVFYEGTVISELRCDYAELKGQEGANRQQLEKSIRKRMQDQHKSALKALLHGDFDPTIRRLKIIDADEANGATTDSLPPKVSSPAPTSPPALEPPVAATAPGQNSPSDSPPPVVPAPSPIFAERPIEPTRNIRVPSSAELRARAAPIEATLMDEPPTLDRDAMDFEVDVDLDFGFSTTHDPDPSFDPGNTLVDVSIEELFARERDTTTLQLLREATGVAKKSRKDLPRPPELVRHAPPEDAATTMGQIPRAALEHLRRAASERNRQAETERAAVASPAARKPAPRPQTRPSRREEEPQEAALIPYPPPPPAPAGRGARPATRVPVQRTAFPTPPPPPASEWEANPTQENAVEWPSESFTPTKSPPPPVPHAARRDPRALSETWSSHPETVPAPPGDAPDPRRKVATRPVSPHATTIRVSDWSLDDIILGYLGTNPDGEPEE